ncbi:MAG: hypothetical protein Satyrvirus51_1, partial [Satyrvirus sp.]
SVCNADIGTCATMMDEARKYDDLNAPSSIDFDSLTETSAINALFKLCTDLKLDTQKGNNNMKFFDSSKFPPPNQNVADFLRLSCYFAAGPNKFSELNSNKSCQTAEQTNELCDESCDESCNESCNEQQTTDCTSPVCENSSDCTSSDDSIDSIDSANSPSVCRNIENIL